MQHQSQPNKVSAWTGLAYGGFAFAATFAFFTCFVLFLGNLPKISEPWLATTVDTGRSVNSLFAVIWDIGLVALFGLQHSIMARPAFKAWWTRIVPEGLERSTYVLAACAAGFFMLLFWMPIPYVIWNFGEPASHIFWALFAIGWLLLLASGINFGIFELLGLRQAWAWSRGRATPQPTLKAGGLYRIMRHPMYVGVLLGFWMTPYMTAGHLLLAAGFTFYLLIAMHFEERDLRRTFGRAYEAQPMDAKVARLRF